MTKSMYRPDRNVIWHQSFVSTVIPLFSSKILAAGSVQTEAYNPDPYSIQDAIRSATYTPNADLTAQCVF
jgi:hypothetical protein